MWTKKQKCEYARNWKRNNPEKIKKTRDKYRKRNREKINAQKRAWDAEHRDRINEARRKRESTPEAKAKRAEYRRNHKHKPSQEMRKRWTVRARLHWRKLKARAVELLGGACTVCGIEDSPAIYDFHHRDPGNKDFSISQGKTWAKIELEIQKCDLVCANCHRKLHLVG